jgi:Amt family ammonium transporter
VIGYGQFFFQDPAKFATFFFQYVFAATAATIAGGALAERCEYTATLIFSIFIAGCYCFHAIFSSLCSPLIVLIR